jgi:hypothetical protein
VEAGLVCLGEIWEKQTNALCLSQKGENAQIGMFSFFMVQDTVGGGQHVAQQLQKGCVYEDVGFP